MTRLATALRPLRRRKDVEAVLTQQGHDIAWLKGEVAAMAYRIDVAMRETDERTAYLEAVCQSRQLRHVEEMHIQVDSLGTRSNPRS